MGPKKSKSNDNNQPQNVAEKNTTEPRSKVQFTPTSTTVPQKNSPSESTSYTNNPKQNPQYNPQQKPQTNQPQNQPQWQQPNQPPYQQPYQKNQQYTQSQQNQQYTKQQQNQQYNKESQNPSYSSQNSQYSYQNSPQFQTQCQQPSSKQKGQKYFTKVVVRCNAGFGNNLFLRGEGIPNLSWQQGTQMKNVKADEWCWETDQYFTKAQIKVLFNDKQYEVGDNHWVEYGKTLTFIPYF
jgi:FtsZ-interacting cell division protein ZipA